MDLLDLKEVKNFILKFWKNITSKYYCSLFFCLQQIFDNIINRDIQWPKHPEEISFEAYDLMNK